MEPKTLNLKLLGNVKRYWRMQALSVVFLVLAGSFVAKDVAIIRWIPLTLVALLVLRGITSFISIDDLAHVGHHTELLAQQFHAEKDVA